MSSFSHAVQDILFDKRDLSKLVECYGFKGPLIKVLADGVTKDRVTPPLHPAPYQPLTHSQSQQFVVNSGASPKTPQRARVTSPSPMWMASRIRWPERSPWSWPDQPRNRKSPAKNRKSL